MCAYDGTNFNGWQKQSNRESVQDKIEDSLAGIFGQPIRTIGAGRTDAGVHASGQVFHFDATWNHPAQALLQALRVSFPSWDKSQEGGTCWLTFSCPVICQGKALPVPYL